VPIDVAVVNLSASSRIEVAPASASIHHMKDGVIHFMGHLAVGGREAKEAPSHIDGRPDGLPRDNGVVVVFYMWRYTVTYG